MKVLLLLTALVAIAGGCASKSYEIDGFAGFSRVDVDGAEGDDRAEGYRLAGNLGRTLLTPGILRGGVGNGLRLNANLSYSEYDDNDYTVWSPQLGPSFRLAVGNPGVFVEPGVTLGAAFAELGDDSDMSWAVRPYARIGLITDWLLLGFEGGYQYADLEFDFGDDPEAWYAGAFLGIRLSD